MVRRNLGHFALFMFMLNTYRIIQKVSPRLYENDMKNCIFTCGEACKSRDDKKSVGGGAGVVVCPELLSKEEVELWFCPELLSKTLVNGKNDA